MRRVHVLILSFILVALISIGGCISNDLKFKECKLQEQKIKETQSTSLWIEVENRGDEQKNISLQFLYPKYLTIERDNRLIKFYNMTIEPNGATSGRKEFKVHGKYIEGQPFSPWDLTIQMYADGKLIKECKLTVTILPPS